MTDAPEFSKIIRVAELAAIPAPAKISASRDERTALAKRFDLPAIHNLCAEYRLAQNNERIVFSGTVTSELEQSCAITGKPFPVTLSEPFQIAFVSAGDTSPSEEEIELEADDCDLIEYTGGRFDLGEAIAQTLYLALDPYPRGPEADSAEARKILTSQEEAGPFGALAALKPKTD